MKSNPTRNLSFPTNKNEKGKDPFQVLRSSTGGPPNAYGVESDCSNEYQTTTMHYSIEKEYYHQKMLSQQVDINYMKLAVPKPFKKWVRSKSNSKFPTKLPRITSSVSPTRPRSP